MHITVVLCVHSSASMDAPNHGSRSTYVFKGRMINTNNFWTQYNDLYTLRQILNSS